MGPNVSLYSGTHPLDPALRNGTRGPEAGKEIHIGEDCWFGGDVVVLPGVTIGKGVTIGAGSVVTKVCLSSLLFSFFFSFYRENYATDGLFVGCASISCGCWESSQGYSQD